MEIGIDGVAHDSGISSNAAIAALTGALDVGQVDVAVHWLQLLLLTTTKDNEQFLKGRNSRMRRLKTLQRAVAQMLGDAENDDSDGRLVLRPGLAVGNCCELSYSQLQMFALQALQPESTAYNVVRALHFTNVAFDLTALKFTCDALMVKHEALRTCFGVDTNAGGQPRQYVHPLQYFQHHSVIKVVECDLLGARSSRDPASVTRLAAFVAQTVDEPFVLETQAPIRVYVFVEPGQKARSPWILAVTLHHIVTDAASSQLFWSGLLAFYTQFLRSKTNADEVVRQLERSSSITYRDFAVWQRARLRSGVAASSMQYWMQQLTEDGVPALLKLPFDKERPHARNGENYEELSAPKPTTAKGNVVVFRSSASLLKAFSELCHAQGVTMFMGLLAIFYMLIERLSGQQDFVIGAPSSGRERAELQDIMGYFVNTLPLRLGRQRNDGENFRAFLAHVREVVLDAYKHMDIPFHNVLEHLRASANGIHRVHADPERRWQHPLFQVMFSWEQSGDSSDDSCSNNFMELRLPHQSAKFDLMLSMRHRQVKTNATTERVLEGSMEYPTSRFSRATVERFSKYYLELLEQVTRSPTLVLNTPALSMLSISERQQLANWGTPQPNALHSVGMKKKLSRFLDEFLLDQVQNTPLNAALHFEGLFWTYQDLWERSGRVARALDQLQTTNARQCHVGLLLDRGLENVAAMVGTLRAKAAFVPLDTEFPHERLRYMARDSRLQIIITQRKHAATAAELVAPQFTPTSEGFGDDDLKTRLVFYEDLEDATSDVTETNAMYKSATNVPESLRGYRPDSDNTAAYILYTSGSTGNPKGVVVPHSALLSTLWWTVNTYDVTPSDVFLQSTSTTLDGSLSQLFSPLLVGASARITRPKGLHDLHYMRNLLLQTPRITFCVFVPSYFALLVDFLSEDSFPSSVRHVVLAGEDFPFELARQFYMKHKRNSTCLVNEYGPTEASITSTSFQLRRELVLQTESCKLQSVPIGKPIDDHPVIVLDAQRRQVPQNVPGELYIGGAGLAIGYWRRPDLTANAFILHDGRRWYKTGDLVKWLPSGDLIFLGRTDAQVKHHGMRIELQEVRNVLLRHLMVKGAEVVISKAPLLRHNKQRQASTRLVGFILLADAFQDGKEYLDDLRAYLSEHLPMHMVPQLRVVTSWPRTPNGKIDLRALASLADVHGEHGSSNSDEPQGASNSSVITLQLATDILRQVWTQALELEFLDGEDSVRCEQELMSRSFFELGGDSLAAIRAIALAQARGLPLALDQFFRSSSLPEMARAAANAMLNLDEWTSKTLVPLNWPTPGASTERPTLFLFHDADGTVWKMLELARQLPFAVVGVQASMTLNGSSQTSNPTTIEELAKLYWDVIHEHQHEGPFALGGFSFGCRLAHEVARLAVSEGHTLLPLILLDGLPFELPTSPQDNTETKRIADRVRIEEYAAKTFGDENSPLRQLGINYRKFCAMEESYQPFSLAEMEAAFSSPKPPVLHAELYMTQRWNADVSKCRAFGLDVKVVAIVPNCTHLTMLRHPNVEQVARCIRQRAER